MKRVAQGDPAAVLVPGYDPIRLIGRGASGAVYEAEDRHKIWGRRVALKVLYRPVPDTLRDDRRWQSVFIEAIRPAILKHPNIVRCLDHGIVNVTSDERRAFVVMEYIEGDTFGAFVARERYSGAVRRTDWGEYQKRVAGLLNTVALAAHEVHVGQPSQGLPPGVHGDISPNNILVDREGLPHLTDFGLSITKGEGGARGGTPGFMAPEASVPGEYVGVKADVWSIGAVLCFALHGTPPGGPMTPSRPTWVHPDLEAVGRKCLDLVPGNRYESARDLAADLDRYLKGEPVHARPAPVWRKVVSWGRKHPTITIVAASLLLMVALSLRTWFQGEQIIRLEKALDVVLPVADLIDPDTRSGRASDLPQEARREVAAQLLPLLDGVIRVRAGNKASRVALARGLVGRARLRHALGGDDDDDAAMADLEEAEELYRNLDLTPETELARAVTIIFRVGILGPQGRFADGLRAIGPAVDTLEGLVRRFPGWAEARFRLARAMSNRASCRNGLAGRSGDLPGERLRALREAARDDYARAIEHLSALVEGMPDDPRFVEWLSRMYGNLGLVLLDLAGTDARAGNEASVAFERAVDVAEDLAARAPASMSAQDALVAAVLNAGDGLYSHGRFSEAEAAYRRAVRLYDVLNDRFPQLREFVWGQALARKSLGLSLARQSRNPEAIPYLDDALRRYNHLAEVYKNVSEIAQERGDLLQWIEKVPRGGGATP